MKAVEFAGINGYKKILFCAGDLADLIFVFFDPIGQALCKRTLTLVEQLSETHADRMRFYLSKADEAGHEGDRQVLRLLGCYMIYFKRKNFQLHDILFMLIKLCILTESHAHILA